MSCEDKAVCDSSNCANCPNKIRTTLAPGVSWPTTAEPKPKASGWRKRAEPKVKADPHALDFFKEAREFVGARIKPAGTTQLVRLYRDAEGTIVGSEEIKLVNQAVIGGANPYMGTSAHVFNEGFRAAEKAYGIGIRKPRVK